MKETLCKLPAERMVFPAWFDHQEKHFSYIEVQFKRFNCMLVKISCPPVETVDENCAIKFTVGQF